MGDKVRLDVLLAEREEFSSRSRAKKAIMAGEIFVDGERIDKAGTRVDRCSKVEVRGERLPFVSRGGLKLQKALEVFSVDPSGLEAIDVGASTGGFTDCLLQAGAKKVYAVDVGYGQLAWKVRQDERVEVIERTNFRYLTPEEFPVEVPLIVIDVSFISLKLIVPAALKFLSAEGEIVALIKPQFEAGPERLGNNGVVRKSSVHCGILNELLPFFHGQGLEISGLDYSPVTGAKGHNIEFLIHLVRKENAGNRFRELHRQVTEVVERAHRELERG
ncbi:MAG: TlyA family RNA methyltransferase [Halanaerobiaceae bacterium]